MTQEHRVRPLRNFLTFLSVIIFSGVLSGAEILFEENWERIISGDRASYITRGGTEEPLPLKVSDKTITTIFKTLDPSQPNPVQIKAWQQGLAKFGWAQQENEPEHTSYQAIQIVIANQPR